MNFGARIQQVIDELKISQSELGRRVGATSQSVSGWISSGILPREKIMDQLEAATGKPLYWFFMTDKEARSYDSAMRGTTDLTENEKNMLAIFRKFPSAEQKAMIDTFNARLEELDNFFNELAKIKGIQLDKNK